TRNDWSRTNVSWAHRGSILQTHSSPCSKNPVTSASPMKTMKHNILGGFQAATFVLAAFSAQAQVQTTGTPGSPSATTTVDGKQLPAPDPKFGGVIKDNALQSKSWWAPRVVPPKSAPNVLLIMTADL